MTSTWLPAVLSTGCSLTARGGGFSGHRHAFDEICLVANEPSIIRHAGIERKAEPGTVFLFREGECHGYRNEADAEPHLWLVHFERDPALSDLCPRLADPDPERRVWTLTAQQESAYRGLFMRLQAELAMPQRPGHAAAVSSWLRLILLAAARWDEIEQPGLEVPVQDPEVMLVWEIVHEHIDHPADFSAALQRRVVNYDAVRHRFKRTFGVSPRDVLQRERLARARHLLLDSDVRISDIAERLGYARAQEFSRAFHVANGVSPGAFRENPWSVKTQPPLGDAE